MVAVATLVHVLAEERALVPHSTCVHVTVVSMAAPASSVRCPCLHHVHHVVVADLAVHNLCTTVTCPSATAWSDFATATDTAHATAECSNRVSEWCLCVREQLWPDTVFSSLSREQGQCTEDVGTCACDGNFNKDASANNCNKRECRATLSYCSSRSCA